LTSDALLVVKKNGASTNHTSANGRTSGVSAMPRTQVNANLASVQIDVVWRTCAGVSGPVSSLRAPVRSGQRSSSAAAVSTAPLG